MEQTSTLKTEAAYSSEMLVTLGQTVRRNLLPPSSGYKIYYAVSSEILVTFYRTTRRHILEDKNHDTHCSDNIRSHTINYRLGYEGALHLKLHTWIISEW
jgi:hypothetical protein